jgi:hypothetical protein
MLSTGVIIGIIVAILIIIIIIIIVVVTMGSSKKTTTTPKTANPIKTNPKKSYKVTGCEGAQLLFSCPNSGKLIDAQLKYGRWDNSTCVDSSIKSDTESKFKNYNILDKCVGGKCDIAGKSFNKVLNDDPYFGVTKHWELNASCEY